MMYILTKEIWHSWVYVIEKLHWINENLFFLPLLLIDLSVSFRYCSINLTLTLLMNELCLGSNRPISCLVFRRVSVTLRWLCRVLITLGFINFIQGHCWPGEVQQHHISLLQKCQGNSASVRHHKAGDIWRPAQVDENDRQGKRTLTLLEL